LGINTRGNQKSVATKEKRVWVNKVPTDECKRKALPSRGRKSDPKVQAFSGGRLIKRGTTAEKKKITNERQQGKSDPNWEKTLIYCYAVQDE